MGPTGVAAKIHRGRAPKSAVWWWVGQSELNKCPSPEATPRRCWTACIKALMLTGTTAPPQAITNKVARLKDSYVLRCPLFPRSNLSQDGDIKASVQVRDLLHITNTPSWRTTLDERHPVHYADAELRKLK